MHDEPDLGEVCPECGTHHRVIESIPAQPLTQSLVEELRESTNFTFVRGTNWISAKDLGLSTDQEVTEDLIIGTQTKALYLKLYEPGWVVEIEEKPFEDEDETVEDVAQEILLFVSHDREELLFEMLEIISTELDPTYDCPECDYLETGGSTLARNFLFHLTESHNYTGEKALSVLEECTLDAE